MKRNIVTRFKHLSLNNSERTWILLLPFSEKYWLNKAILEEECSPSLIKRNGNEIILTIESSGGMRKYRVVISLL